MKYLILLSIAFANLTYAMKNDDLALRAADVVKSANALKGQSFEMEPKLMQDWMQLKSQMLRAASQELAKMASQVKNEETQDQFYDIINRMRKLSSSFKNFKLPDQKITKTISNPNEWLELKARKSALIARELKNIANQVKDQNVKDMLNKYANHKEAWANALYENIKSMSTQTIAPKPSSGMNPMSENMPSLNDEQFSFEDIREIE